MGGIRGTGSNKLANRTNNCGGNKKAGIPSTIGRPRWIADEIKSRAWPTQPFVISKTNVLSGGVGRHQNMFRAPADGVNIAALNANKVKCEASCNNCSVKVM